MKPAQVLDVAAATRDYLRTTAYRGYLRGFAHSTNRASTDETAAALADEMAADEINRFEAGYAHHVDADMTDVIVAAAAALDDGDPWTKDLPPTPVGYLVFDKSLPGVDIRGRSMPVKAITWRTGKAPRGGPALLLTMYVSHAEVGIEAQPDAPDYSEDEIREFVRTVGDLQVVHITGMEFGEPVGPLRTTVTEAQAARINAGNPGKYPVLVGDVAESMSRQVYAAFAIMRQTITDVTDGDVAPGHARRSQRRRIPPRVTVIRLRHTAPSSSRDGDGTSHWSYRTIVRGHWRRARVGPGRTERRLVWVHAHVKGPEGAPLHVPERVYTLTQ